MPISIEHNPGVGEYGQAIFDSAKSQEDYARMMQIQDQMMKLKAQNNEYALGKSGQDLQKYIANQQNALGLSSQELQRYLGDQSHELGTSGQQLQRDLGNQSNALGQSQQELQRYLGDQGNAANLAQLKQQKEQAEAELYYRKQVAGLVPRDYQQRQVVSGGLYNPWGFGQ